jgi:uncharacterized SAM-binding protein YcdF (DUF218 family)
MRSIKRIVGLLFLILLLANPFTQSWLAGKYVVDDGLAPADVIVALRGSQEEERIRMTEAVRLVREHYAPAMMFSSDARPFFDVRERQVVESYWQRAGVPASQLSFCENTADSTLEEAHFLLDCLRQSGAKQVIIVTSAYHTRRSRFIFQHVFSGTGIVPRLHPVSTEEFWDQHWWRRRRWAKTHAEETAKLVWSAMERWVLRK